MLIDTHAHLNFPDFEKDLDKVIKRSVESGVAKIICVGSNLQDSTKVIELAKKYPNIIYAAVGIHPHQTDHGNKDSVKEQIKQLKKLAVKKEVMAIGECGLDFSGPPARLAAKRASEVGVSSLEENRSKKDQIFLFQKQIEIASQLNLPLIVHSRQANREVTEILFQYTSVLNMPLRGVFHCYSGGKKDIKKIEEIGFYFGLDGNLTYDVGLQNVAKLIPLEKILLETDCPFLTPQPFRSLRNEPKNVRIIAEFLAQLKGLSLDQLAKIITENTHAAFFGKTR